MVATPFSNFHKTLIFFFQIVVPVVIPVATDSDSIGDNFEGQTILIK